MITGDHKLLEEGSLPHARLQLQRAQVDALAVVYMGRGALWPTVSKGAYDVVTVQDPFWRGVYAWRVARSNQARLNVQVHTDLSAQSFLRRCLARFVLRRADSVRVVSQKIQTQVAEMVPRAKVSVLPIYVDVSRFAGLVHVPHPRFKKTLVWIGRFESEKDPQLALSILEAVRRGGIDAGLIMLGAGSKDAAVRARAAGMQPYVELPGWQDPAPYLAQADVVLSTSRHESYGASMLEALAAGVPVVAPDVGIAREAGATVAERSDLAGAVTQVLQNGRRGKLAISLLTKEEWTTRWRESLE